MAMQQLLLDAALAHPERAEYDRAVANGVDPERAARLLSPQPALTLRDGPAVWRVQNNPAALEAHAASAAKCPGFNGRKTPKPRVSKGTGEIYRHYEAGFKLLIPSHLTQSRGETELAIGSVLLVLEHKTRRIKGSVPASWLVDLNAGDVQPDAHEEQECVVEDLL